PDAVARPFYGVALQIGILWNFKTVRHKKAGPVNPSARLIGNRNGDSSLREFAEFILEIGRGKAACFRLQKMSNRIQLSLQFAVNHMKGAALHRQLASDTEQQKDNAKADEIPDRQTESDRSQVHNCCSRTL